MGACPHYPSRHSFHTPNFEGTIAALVQCIYTISGVGTTTFTLDPSGYASNFEGLVQCIEDLNFTMSGLSAGGGSAVQAGSGIYFTSSGTTTVINATITSASGAIFTAGSGLYLVNGTQFNVNYNQVFQGSVSGHILGAGDNTVTYSGNTVTISGSGVGPGPSVTVSGNPQLGYSNGSLWFDTNEGRLFVYASGNGISDPAWYQTNAEALAYKGESPPSGTGLNAPPRDGSLWFNNLMGNLFVYDATSSGWYETGPSRSFAYGSAAPASTSSPGAGWLDTTVNRLKVWNGSTWADIDIDGGVY
jgi:hypothetical protein